MNGLSWICSVPRCATAGTVEDALRLLHRDRSNQLVVTTEQGHALGTLSLKDLLWGLAARTLRLEQSLSQVPSLHPLHLLLLTDTQSQADWWSLWKRLGTVETYDPFADYGLISVTGEFLGLLDYEAFLDTLVHQCPDWPIPLPLLESEPVRSVFPRAIVPPINARPDQEAWVLAFVWLRTIAAVSPLHHRLYRENQDLRWESQQKDGLLNLLNHDLKTPLSSILGLATLLKEGIGAETPGRQRYYSQLIYQSGRYLMGIVNRLMAVSRLETGQRQLNRTLMPLQAMLDQSWRLAQGEIALRSPVESSDPIPPPIEWGESGVTHQDQIWGDPVYTEELLTALLTYGLEQAELWGTTLRFQLQRWGTAAGKPPPWLGFSLRIPVETIAIQRMMGNPGEWFDYRRANADNIDWWVTRRLAQWHGGETHRFGAEVTVLLPQFPLNSDPPVDPSFILLGIPSQAGLDPSALSYLLPWVDPFREAGVLTLFAPSLEELIYKLKCFRPAIVVVDSSWELVWDTLAEEVSLPRDSFTLVSINLDLNSFLTHPSSCSLRETTLLDPAHRFWCHPFPPLPCRCFTLPQEAQTLYTYLSTVLGSCSPQLPLKTLLWIGFPTPHSDDRSFTLAERLPDCQIIEAQDLEQAELLARIWEPQAIVVDPSPGQDGEELLKRIQRSETLSALRLFTWEEFVTWNHAHEAL